MTMTGLVMGMVMVMVMVMSMVMIVVHFLFDCRNDSDRFFDRN